MLTLDVGCGTNPHGTINLDLCRPGYLGEWKQLGPHHNWIRASAMKLPFRSEVFDKVYCIVALPYMPWEKTAIQEIYRVLKKEGIFVCSHHKLAFYLRCLPQDSKRRVQEGKWMYPIRRSLGIVLKIVVFLLLQNKKPQFYYPASMTLLQTERGLRKLLEKCRFHVIKMESRDPYYGFTQFIDCEAKK